MTNALSTITVMPSTTEGIQKFCKKAKSEILSGKYDPLEIEMYLKALEEIIKSLRQDKEIGDYSLSEAFKYNEKQFERYGAKFAIRETGVKYDYLSCNDEKWTGLQKEIETLTEQRKKREEFLKKLKEPVADVNTGNIIISPVKSSKTTLIVSLL